MTHGDSARAAPHGPADDPCGCTVSYTDPNCYCPPDSPKTAGASPAAAPHALTHSHESLGSFTRNLSAMSLDDSASPRNPPGRVSPDFRGSEGRALTQAARTLSNLSVDAGVAPPRALLV